MRLWLLPDYRRIHASPGATFKGVIWPDQWKKTKEAVGSSEEGGKDINIFFSFFKNSGMFWICLCNIWHAQQVRFFADVYVLWFAWVLFLGRVLGRIWDKSLQSFPPCYSLSPVQTADFAPPPPSLPDKKWFVTLSGKRIVLRDFY